MTRTLFYCKLLTWAVLLALILVACNRDGQPVPSSLPPTPIPATPTPAAPTATSLPLAAIANGWEITLAEYQAELALYQAAAGTNLATEDQKRVLDDLVDQALLAQAAAENGFAVDQALLQERIDQLAGQLGGQPALDEWIAAHGYDEQTFQQALQRSVAAAWMRDQIIAGVPKTAEQVRARQVLLYNADEANAVLAQLQAGADFAELARRYDPLTAGDLGWFPHGFLLDLKLEEAAFGLQPGQYSSVIETLAGFHILQVLERNPQRALEPQALLALQSRALKDWLEKRRQESNVQVLLP